MPSLQELYQPGPSQALIQEGVNRQAGYAAEDAGLKQTLLKRNFETRTLPDLVNRQAGRGAFFSSATGNHADRAREDYVTEAGDTTRLLQRSLADLSRKRILGALGVSV